MSEVAEENCESIIIPSLKKCKCKNIKRVYEIQRGKAWERGTKELAKQVLEKKYYY